MIVCQSQPSSLATSFTLLALRPICSVLQRPARSVVAIRGLRCGDPHLSANQWHTGHLDDTLGTGGGGGLRVTPATRVRQ